MHYLPLIVALIVGFALGLAAAVLFRITHTRSARQLAAELLSERETERRSDMETVIAHVKASFGSLSLEALSRSTEEFLKLAKARLDAEREVNVRGDRYTQDNDRSAAPEDDRGAGQRRQADEGPGEGPGGKIR
jgi:type II secretory pathway pseudopilin PulG